MQQCNNFALKSIRAYFHDYMSDGVEGSVLNENDLDMNVGLCRYTQYLNVLSDETQCDPGSILAMAGQLGFDACGVEIWRVDQDVMPEVQINRGFECEATGSRLNDLTFNQTTHQRLDMWNDAIVSANSTNQERFWCTINPHACDRPSDGLSDGEAEYSGDATASAHIIGRVTCPVTGQTADGSTLTTEAGTGFFHMPRGTQRTSYAGVSASAGLVGMDQLRARFKEGNDRFGSTQCIDHGSQISDFRERFSSTGGIRPSTSQWPIFDTNETRLSSVSGLCGMPTHFLGTVRLLYLENITRPSSDALSRFEAIAWDGVDTTSSAWDTCTVGCPFINVSKNRLCGGSGLSDFEWSGTTPIPDGQSSTTPTPDGQESNSGGGNDDSDDSATALYVGIGVGVLGAVVIGALLYIFISRRTAKRSASKSKGTTVTELPKWGGRSLN
eukprot:g2238.t1